MAVKIRLARRGRKKAPFYHIVVADARSPRDGKFIEKIGSYNPMTVPATIQLDGDKAIDWIEKGAQPTDTARAILRFRGVMYRLHLLRGVKKGALTIEQADKLYEEKVAEKDSKVAERVAKTAAEKEALRKIVDGTAKAAPVSVEAEQEAQDAFKAEGTAEEGAPTEASGEEE